MKHLLISASLAVFVIALTGCQDDDAPATPSRIANIVNVNASMQMKGLSGSNTVGTFGIAQSESDAKAGRGSLLSGSITWTETNGGKQPKYFVLSGRPVGEKLWVFLTSDNALATGQTISASVGVSTQLTLSSTSDAIVIGSFTVSN